MKNREVLKLLQNLPENTKGYIDSKVPKTYAGSNTAGGVATQAAKTTGTLTIQTNGTNAGTFNGSANKTINITVASIGAASSTHTHSNYALTSHTHLYAGSSTAGGVATEAAKTTGNLTIKTNGTDALSFNGSASKSLDITVDSIGAATANHSHSNYALASHTHLYAASKTAGGVATEAAKTTGTLTIQTNGVSAITFNGSANKSLDITPASIGAATSDHTHSNYALVSHTHNYAGSKTSGGAATEAAKTTGTLTLQTNGTNAGTFNGSANKTVNITATSIGAATSDHTHSNYALTTHTHPYAGSDTAGGVATEAAKTTGTLTIQTNGTNAGTFNGSANKSININPANIGAATVDHTHSNYATTSHSHGLLNFTLCKELANTTTGGWSLLNNTYEGFLLMSLRTNANAPNWLVGNYASGIAFGGSDTKGVISVAYQSPLIRFAGGNGEEPKWNLALTGSNGGYYDLNNFATKSSLSGYATASHTHNYAGSSSAGGVATEAAKTTGTLTIQTDGTSAGAFNGSANKTINITAASIGAAASNHTHSNYLTPNALNNYVTTSVLSNYASKNDLSNYATKADLGNINAILDEINGVSL